MKQRLVGAIVLGCLAIIFLPILLDGEGVSPPEMNTTIPVPPPFPEPMEIEPQRPVIISDNLPQDEPAEAPEAETIADNEATPDSPAPVVDATPAVPELDASGLPEAWSIRLGVFADAANAENLVERLQGQQYRAYSEQINRPQGILNAVFVGPVVTRAEAEALQAELSENVGLDGIIVDFDIETNR